MPVSIRPTGYRAQSELRSIAIPLPACSKKVQGASRLPEAAIPVHIRPPDCPGASMTAFAPPDRRAFVAGLAATVLTLDSGRAQQTPAQATPSPAGKPAEAPPPAGPPVEQQPAQVLRAGPASRRILAEPAGETAGLGFNGGTAAPVLRTRHNAPFAVRFENGMAEPATLHWFGLHGANAMDGAGGLTQPPVLPGEHFDYRFTPTHTGTHWFHSLVPGYAASQLDRGLAGVLVVEEDAPPPCDRDVAVLLDDWRLAETGAPIEPYNDITDTCRSGRLGNRLTVNGHIGVQLG